MFGLRLYKRESFSTIVNGIRLFKNWKACSSKHIYTVQQKLIERHMQKLNYKEEI